MRLGYFSFAACNTPSILCVGNIFTVIHGGVLLFLSVCYSVGLFGWHPFLLVWKFFSYVFLKIFYILPYGVLYHKLGVGLFMVLHFPCFVHVFVFKLSLEVYQVFQFLCFFPDFLFLM